MRSGHVTRSRKDQKQQHEDAESTDMRDMIQRFRIATKSTSQPLGGETLSADRALVDETARFIAENTSITALNTRPYDPFIRSLGPRAWELVDHCV